MPQMQTPVGVLFEYIKCERVFGENSILHLPCLDIAQSRVALLTCVAIRHYHNNHTNIRTWIQDSDRIVCERTILHIC